MAEQRLSKHKSRLSAARFNGEHAVGPRNGAEMTPHFLSAATFRTREWSGPNLGSLPRLQQLSRLLTCGEYSLFQPIVTSLWANPHLSFPSKYEALSFTEKEFKKNITKSEICSHATFVTRISYKLCLVIRNLASLFISVVNHMKNSRPTV